MKMFLASMGGGSGTLFPRAFWTKQETMAASLHSSVLHRATPIARHASVSAELYVNVTVTLNICRCDSVNDCHKSVAISGILSVCGA